MASLQTNTKGMERAVLSTTIKKDILENFKSYCKLHGYPLNMILDIFMEQFVKEDFMLKLSNNYINQYESNVKHIFNGVLDIDIFDYYDELHITINNNTYILNTKCDTVKQMQDMIQDNNDNINMFELVDKLIDARLKDDLKQLKTYFIDVYTKEHYLYLKTVLKGHYRAKMELQLELI